MFVHLQSLFSPYGEILHTKVVFRKDTAESLTYGFVKFVRNEDASNALNGLNGLEIYGKKIKVSYARPSDPEIKNSKIFITRLPKSYTTEDITELFREVKERSNNSKFLSLFCLFSLFVFNSFLFLIFLFFFS